MSVSRRTGTHPLDRPLEDSTPVLGWVAPSLELLFARIITLLPFGIAMAVFVWLVPKMAFAGPFDEGWLGLLDTVLRTAIGTAIAMLGYAVLARAEGREHGVGDIRALPDAAIRLAVVVCALTLLGWVLGHVLQAILTSTFMLRLIMNLVRTFDIWGVYAILWVLSPLALLLGTFSTLCQIGAIRSRESLGTMIAGNLGAVFGQARRFIVPSLIFSGVLILIVHALGKLVTTSMALWLLQNAIAVIMTVAAVATLIALPWSFVVERALRPDWGIEDDVDPLLADASGTPDPDAVARTAAVAAVSAAREAAVLPAPDDVRSRYASVVESDGALMASRRLVTDLRSRRIDQVGFIAGLEALPADAPILPELSTLAESWQEASRPGELAWLVRVGLKRDKAFLMDRPDTAFMVANRLIQQQQPKLAAHLLLSFLNTQRKHPGHMDAGLKLARLMAFQLDDGDGARRLLDKLETLYPQAQQITMLRRQLP